MFTFKKVRDNEARKNVAVVEDMITELNKLVDGICKATGGSAWDLISGLDETTGAIVGAAIQSSNRMLSLAYEQAIILDRYESKMDELTELTKKLASQLEK